MLQLTVVDMSLSSGDVKERFLFSLRERPISSLDIDGDFIAFILDSPYVVMVCNWKTKQVIVFDQVGFFFSFHKRHALYYS